MKRRIQTNYEQGQFMMILCSLNCKLKWGKSSTACLYEKRLQLLLELDP